MTTFAPALHLSLIHIFDKRTFYKTQQERIAEFANKVHNGEITNAAGEKFTTVVQIGIGGSDLGPRAMYIALENWAKKNNSFKGRGRSHCPQWTAECPPQCLPASFPPKTTPCLLYTSRCV